LILREALTRKLGKSCVKLVNPANDILVIEDNRAFVLALSAFLGPRVFSVSTLAEGQLALKHHTFTHVLLDLDLPDSGFAATLALVHQLRAEAHPALLIIITGCPGAVSAGSLVLEKNDEQFTDKLMSALSFTEQTA
jgi:ActR/RegA family two-component response regulator